MEKQTYFGSIFLTAAGPDTVLTQAPLSVRIKKAAYSLWLGIALGGVLIGISFAGGWKWLMWVGIVLGGLLALMGIITLFKGKVAACPFCSATIGLDTDTDLSNADENEVVECPKCHEWCISNAGKLRPLDEETFAKKKKVRAPMFADGSWPNECLTCGAPVTRRDKLSKNSLDAAVLLVGTVSVRSASVENIPYCDAHSEQCTLSFDDDKAKFRFKDLQAMRRYTSVNFGKQPLKSKKK